MKKIILTTVVAATALVACDTNTPKADAENPLSFKPTTTPPSK